jgi:predicted DNA-binding transcriptional regulator YafY
MNGIFIRGMETRHPIEIIYSNKDGRLTQRVITVVELADSHIIAYCHLRHEARVFKLDSILSAVPYTRRYRNKGII